MIVKFGEPIITRYRIIHKYLVSHIILYCERMYWRFFINYRSISDI